MDVLGGDQYWKSVNGSRFGRISLIIVIAGVLYTPGQTDLSRTGIQSILVSKLVGLYKSKVLLLGAKDSMVPKAARSLSKIALTSMVTMARFRDPGYHGTFSKKHLIVVLN